MRFCFVIDNLKGVFRILGIITLLLAIFVQIGYTIFCIYKNEAQPMIKNTLRVCSFGLLSLLLLLGVYQWGFRWIPLLLLLALFAIIGIVYFVKKPVSKKPFRPYKSICSCIVSILLLALCISPSIIFPQNKPPKLTGEYSIATTAYTYTDKNRLETYTNSGENRKVTVNLWFPQNAEGKYPLVVFSHGLYGLAQSNTSTFMELASNGYVVCSISHTYQSMYTLDADGNRIIVSSDFMKEAPYFNDDNIDEETKVEFFNKWLKLRTDDMNFVLDTILENAVTKGNDEVYQLIDKDKIGLFGHSMGGSTAAATGKDRSDISAIVNIDAPLSVDFFSFEGSKTMTAKDIYPKPLLNIYSDTLWGHMDEDPKYYANFRLLYNTGGEVYNIHFKGSKHLSFSDLPLLSPILANMMQGGKAEIDKYYCIESMNGLILEFFNCYVKNEDSFNPLETY